MSEVATFLSNLWLQCPQIGESHLPKKKNASNFEKDLQELENLVEKMEGGELSLEESLVHFERGIALTRSCQKALSEAEQKIQILLSEDGSKKLQPFSSDENPDDNKEK